jgi:hypothetical protein
VKFPARLVFLTPASLMIPSPDDTYLLTNTVFQHGRALSFCGGIFLHTAIASSNPDFKFLFFQNNSDVDGKGNDVTAHKAFTGKVSEESFITCFAFSYRFLSLSTGTF